ncbi:Hypothetical protein CINCED_3A025514 [Cinara cedri]|uniref:Uncharacterized protein n=1 Tax=Cinara cedri TaxID=506608 RepID=A0A5E4NBP8_9HEMI|nr:Hypothetical protein CINCED_3A025514 [Cinara cedri]
MEVIEKLMLDKIVIKMKRFKMNEIQQLFKILHFNLEWNQIVSMVADCRLRLSVGNIVCVINEYLKSKQMLIEETYHKVLLVDAIYHQSNQWWTVSIDKVNKRLLDKEIIRNNIQSMLDKINIKGICYVMKYGDLFWVLINISENAKKKRTSVKLGIPHLFTIAPGNVFHVFHRPQNIDNRLLKIVIKSVGANKFKSYPLTGKNVQSMIHFLGDKDKEKENVQELSNNFKEEDVKAYVQKLFGTKRRILNQFTINVESFLPVYSNTSSSSNNNSVGKVNKSKIELKAESIIDGVKDMILAGILTPPYPDWVTKLPALGKNNVHIEIRS